MAESTFVHLVAGGIGGTVGAIATCPLEVLKTRLQSSGAAFHHSPVFSTTRLPFLAQPQVEWCNNVHTATSTTVPHQVAGRGNREAMGIYRCLRYIVATEGGRALFRGLGPNLVGVAPSRAVYFYTYATTKKMLNQRLPPETPAVHMASAVCAGVTASTLTNPIWFIKTRLQLDQSRHHHHVTTAQVIRQVYKQQGLKGFYKGITASYFGTVETVMHFVVYEFLKAQVLARNHEGCSRERSVSDFLEFMLCGAISKTFASILAYPHEVARTRLREDGGKYRGFFQTLLTVAREEGFRALYGGMATQLVRQIPNTAIMMSTYELVVYLFSKDEQTPETPAPEAHTPPASKWDKQTPVAAVLDGSKDKRQHV